MESWSDNHTPAGQNQLRTSAQIEHVSNEMLTHLILRLNGRGAPFTSHLNSSENSPSTGEQNEICPSDTGLQSTKHALLTLYTRMTTIDVMTRFWSFYRIQTLLIHQTNVWELYYIGLCVIDFRSYLVCFRPCISQCTLMLIISPV